MEIFRRISVVLSRLDSVRWTVVRCSWCRRWSLKEIDRESVNALRCWHADSNPNWLFVSFDDETDDSLADNKSSLCRKLSVWVFRSEDDGWVADEAAVDVDWCCADELDDMTILDMAVAAAIANAALVVDEEDIDDDDDVETLTVESECVELPANDVKLCCFDVLNVVCECCCCLFTIVFDTEHAFIPDSTISLIADDFSAIFSVTPPPPVVSFNIDFGPVFAIIQSLSYSSFRFLSRVRFFFTSVPSRYLLLLYLSSVFVFYITQHCRSREREKFQFRFKHLILFRRFFRVFRVRWHRQSETRDEDDEKLFNSQQKQLFLNYLCRKRGKEIFNHMIYSSTLSLLCLLSHQIPGMFKPPLWIEFVAPTTETRWKMLIIFNYAK